jgi:large subunit ribosomal protein L3
MSGILGKKIGMTQVYDKSGKVIPVTVIKVAPCVVTGVKTESKDGYKALQLGFEDIAERKLNNPKKAFYKKINVKPKRYLKEIRVENSEDYKVGQEIKPDIFKTGDKVKVSGLSIGKGFAGAMKRHHFNGGPETHGSNSHRKPCSGGATAAARTLKGMRGPGRMGHVLRTALNLEVVNVDIDKGLLLVKGSLPGPRGNFLVIRQLTDKK